MKLKLAIVFYGLVFLSCSEKPPQDDFSRSLANGEKVFKTCAGCHGKKGEGYKSLSPPLAQSDFLLNSTVEELVRIVKFGLEGEIVVNGKTYNAKMPAQKFDDQQIADVLNYVRNSFGNKGAFISKEEVTKVKSH